MDILGNILSAYFFTALLFPYATGRILRKIRDGYGEINRNISIDPALIRLIADAVKGERNDR